MTPRRGVFGYGVVILILALVLAPHLGLLLLSFATIWSFSARCPTPTPSRITAASSARARVYIKNTLIYASLAGRIDVVLGGAIAYLVLRTKLVGRANGSTGRHRPALAIPASCSASAISGPSTASRCPTARRSPRSGSPSCWRWRSGACPMPCAPATPRCSRSRSRWRKRPKISARPRRTVRRIVVPLMTGGILAGFVTSFSTAAVELSATLMLVQSNSDAPLAYGLYVFMQSAGRAWARRGARRRRRLLVVALHLPLASHHRTQPEGQGNGPMNERIDITTHTGPPSPSTIEGVNLSYGDQPCAEGRQPRDPARRILRLSGPIRLRQDHAAAADRRLQPPIPARPRSAASRHLDAAAVEARCRHGLPVLCALAAHDRGPQRRLRAGGTRRAARRGRAARRCRARSGRPEAISPSGGPRSSPAASSSASRLPAPSRSSRRCCCSTSRSRTSTPRCACRCGANCATCSSAWADDDLRHPRPGRGEHDLRPHRRDE
jgi:hypothetical protein